MPKPKANPVEALAKQVNEKARELQGVQESVDEAKRRIVELQLHEQRLRKELESVEASIKERQAAFEEVVLRERKFLSDVQLERAGEESKLEHLKHGIAALTRDQALLGMMVEEARGFAVKRDGFRDEYLKEKERFESADLGRQKALRESETAVREASMKQKELDAFKQHLTDFYGKVATYVRTAKETLEFVNQELERKGTPVRFGIPDGERLELTMDNFQDR